MSDAVDAVVDVTPAPEAPPAPRKEHWKVREKRLREEALARGEAPAATEPARVAAVPTGAVCDGFLTWDSFCNSVAIDLVTSQFGFQMLTNYTGDEAAQVFFSRMRLAYESMKKAHATGVGIGL